MLTKSEKQRFVKDGMAALRSCKSVAIIQLDGTPDRLLQLSKNRLRGEAQFILGRKSLLGRILEGNSSTKELSKCLGGTCAIVLTDIGPFELAARLRENVLKLSAKPNQAAPVDITIPSQETTLQPGQAVTELKQAGIDVQIQKGKVVIAKDKTIKQGEVVTTGMAKALHSLNITPFTAKIEPYAVFYGGMVFNSRALSITSESVAADIARAFASALRLSFESNIVNQYTISSIVEKAYMNAVCLGVQQKLYDRGIIEKLIERAVLEAKGVPIAPAADSAEGKEQ